VTAVRQVSKLTGKDASGNEIAITGNAVLELHFRPDELELSKDTSAIPERSVVRLAEPVRNALASSVEQLATLDARVTALESAPSLLAAYVAPGGYNTLSVANDSIRPIDLTALGGDEGVVVVIPPASPSTKGRTIRLYDTSGQTLGTTSADPRLAIKIPTAQTIERLPAATFSGGTLPPEIDGIACVFMTGTNPEVLLRDVGTTWFVETKNF
jgi:hypothetical protein